MRKRRWQVWLLLFLKVARANDMITLKIKFLEAKEIHIVSMNPKQNTYNPASALTKTKQIEEGSQRSNKSREKRCYF